MCLVQAATLETAPAKAASYNKSQFELNTFTTWLLQVHMGKIASQRQAVT